MKMRSRTSASANTEFLTVPRRAVATFERVHGIHVTVHDLTGWLHPHLAAHHRYHRHQHCLTAKAAGHESRCHEWDIGKLRSQLALIRDGRSQVCHMGLLEWVAPVLMNDAPQAVLFAGPRLPGKVVPTAFDRLTVLNNRHNSRSSVAVAKESEGETILESLLQLASRLAIWIAQARELTPQLCADRADSLPREDQIRAFVHDHHRRPVRAGELARLLGLSSTRTAHIVRETTGQTFLSLINAARVETAAILLTQTTLPLKTIALQNGFNDLSYFHRTFRRQLGMTPKAYRQRYRT